MREVRLRNGSMEPEAIVVTTMMSLESMWAENPILAYEAVLLARNPSHQPFGSCLAKLGDIGFLGGAGELHSSVRNVILSAVSGDQFDMTLNSPVAREEVSNA